MNWWGKIIGGVLGFGVANIFGAIIGIWIGHYFDKGLTTDFSSLNTAEQERIQSSFFATTFQLLGHVAKADGRVSEQEIAAAEGVMNHLGLSSELRKSAIDYFNQGKQANFDWQSPLSEFAQLARRQRNLKQMFIEIQIQVAFADGSIEAKEQALLFEFARVLGFSRILIQQLMVMVQAQQQFHQRGAGANMNQKQASASMLKQAYQSLGVDETASDKEVKRAYRKLMAQHHPDKLVAKGLPEHMIKVATEKTQDIKSAYEIIMQARK